jgi:PKD repeat protein
MRWRSLPQLPFFLTNTAALAILNIQVRYCPVLEAIENSSIMHKYVTKVRYEMLVQQGEGRMKRKGLLSICLTAIMVAGLFLVVIPHVWAQSPPFLWYKTYGGTSDDEAHCVIRTSDGGYALAGWTKSSGLGSNRGYLVKTDPSGRTLWSKIYGGSFESVIWSVIQTSDGGYALAGSSVRVVSGLSRGVPWLVRTDSSGNVLWERAYTDLVGAAGNAGAHAIVEKVGGGFVLGGLWESVSFPGGCVPAFWMVTNASGSVTNSRVYGAEYGDLYWESSIDSIVLADGGGYFLAGRWVPGGGFALWKINESGNLVWGPKHFGGFRAYSVAKTSDGGCMLAGSSVTDWWPPWDRPTSVYVVKTDSSGNQQWAKTFSNSHNEAYAIVKTGDGGYAIAGRSTVSSSGGWDFLLMKIDASGNLLWSRGPGASPMTSHDDIAYSLVETATGGFILAGYSEGLGAGHRDFLMVNYGPKLAVTIAPSSAATFVGNSIAFSSSASGGTPPYSYQWYVNGVPVSGATSSTWDFMPSSVGTYFVRLMVTDNYTTTAWSNNVSVSVSLDLSVSIYPTSVTMDVGQVQVFSSTVNGGTPPYSYKWFLNGSQVSGALSDTWVFSPAIGGNYAIVLQVTDGASLTRNSNEATVNVNPDLVVSISPTSATTTVNIPQVFSSIVSGGTLPYSYEWYANDTLVLGASSENMSFSPSELGTYRIYLNVTDNVGLIRKSNEAWLAVHSHPVADFTWSPLKPEVGQIVTFNGSSSTPDGGTLVSFVWDFGDGTTSSGVIVTHAYSSPGNYTATLNVTDSEALWDFKQQQIQVVPLPLSVSITPLSASILLGQSVTFTSTVSGGTLPYSYQWYLDGSSVSPATLNSWTYTPSDTGIHYVYLKVTDAGNSTAHSETARVVVTATPVGGYSVGGYWAPFDKQTGPKPLAVNFALVISLALFLVSIKRKTKKEGK